MILTRDEFTELSDFIADNAGTDLGAFAVGAWLNYQNDNADTDEYAVIRVGEFYAITKITSEWLPIEVSEFVQPFDKNGVYTLRRIKKSITWDY